MRSSPVPTLTQLFTPAGVKLQTFETTATAPGRILRSFSFDDTSVGGCGAGHFTLYADFETTQNLQAANAVRFGAGGGHLQGAYSAGATSIVVDDASDFLAPNVAQSLGAPTYGTAQQYALIDDGVNYETVLVTGKSGFSLTLAAGLAHGYASGVTVAILRYQGLVKSRERGISRTGVLTLTCDGFWSRLNDQLLDYNIVAQECGSAIVGILAMAAQTIPEITFPTSLPNTGVNYTGTGQSETAQAILTKIIQVANTNAANVFYTPFVDASKVFQLISLPVSGAATQNLELFQGISTGKNLVPDSSVRFPTTKWTAGGLTFAPKVLDGQNGFSLAGTGAANSQNGQSSACPTTVGAWYVVSGFMDASGTTVGNLVTFANASFSYTGAGIATAPPGSIGRFSSAAFQATATTTYVYANSNGTTANVGATQKWCAFQLESVSGASGVGTGYEATFPGATQDIVGDLRVRDQDMTSMANVVRVEGGKKADGTQCRVIVRDTTSITNYRQKEQVLNQPSLTDEATAAAWGKNALTVMAYPRTTGTAALTFADLTTSARDYVTVTGFDDGTAFNFNPTAITTTVDAVAYASQSIQLSQVLPDINAIIAEIVGEKIQRAQLGILANPGNFRLVSGCAISASGTTISVASGIAVIAAARVIVAAYPATAQPNNSNRFIWARSTGAIVSLDHPTPDSTSDGFYPDQGILLGIVSVLNGVVSIVQTPSTGVGTVNFAALPNSAIFPGISSIAITLSAEGAVSASAKTTVNLTPGLATSATWLAGYLTTFAKTTAGGSPIGANDGWINPKVVQASAFSNSFTFTENGLDPSQDYDLGLQIQSVLGDKSPPTPALLTLTQPSIAKGTIAIALLANGSTYPAPTFTLAAGYPQNGPSPNGTAADIVVNLTLTNAPTDGSVTGLQYYARINGAVPATWVPHTRLQIATGVMSMSYDQMEGNASYDLACSYIGAGGLGPVTTIATAFAGKVIGIPGSYLLGTIFTPTVTSPVLTITTSVNNVAANVAATFNITNQPTDGSLARVGTWFRKTGDSAWTPWTTIAAIGAGGSVPTPASGSYATRFTDLTNGAGYEFGINGLSFANAEGAIVSLGTITAQTLAIGTSQQLAGALPTPVIDTVTPPTANSVSTLSGMTSRVTVAFTVNNQPTDGSYSRFTMWYRATGATNWSPGPSQAAGNLPTPNTSARYSVDFADLQAGIAYDFGVSYENTQGAESAIASILSNYTAQSIGIPTTYLLGGVSITPVVSSSSVTIAASANGTTAAATITVNVNNQPTNGSLTRVTLWKRLTSQNNGVNTISAASFNWQPIGTLPATGVASVPPPAAGSYVVTDANLDNGLSYDFALSYENAQGGESTLAFFISGFVAQVLAIQPSGTTFSAILNSAFNGLSVDGSGMLAMTTQADIFPAQQLTTLTPGISLNDVSFTMKFKLSGSTQFPALTVFSDASATATSFGNGYFVQWNGNAIALYKRVSNVDTLMQSAASFAQGFGGPAVPSGTTVPALDTNWHTLNLSVARSLSSPGTGLSFTSSLDGVPYVWTSEYPVGTNSSVGGPFTPPSGSTNIGGTTPFLSGRCGPGNRNAATTTLIDPANFQIKTGSSTYDETHAVAIGGALLSTTEAAAIGDGSAVRSKVLGRRHAVDGSLGGNYVFNPTGRLGLQGWAKFDNTGVGSVSFDSVKGGRFYVTIPAGTNSGTDTLISQYVTVPSTGGAMTFSGLFEASSIASGQAVIVDAISGSSTLGSTQLNTSNNIAGPNPFSLSFTPASGQTSIQLRLRAYSPQSPTTACSGYFYSIQFEYGASASAYSDDTASALVSQTHDANGNLDLSRGQSGKLVPYANSAPAVTTALDVSGQVNGIGTTRFVTGTTAQTSIAGSAALTFPIAMQLPTYGTWFISMLWFVSFQSAGGTTVLVEQAHINTTATVSGMTAGYTTATVANAGNYANIATGATCSGAPGLNATFNLVAQSPAALSTDSGILTAGTWSISAFRTS
ncbi:MAG: hypothetical protein NVSMB19_19830 [Vulcanimicrobiaceae bacterium]